MCRLLYTHHYGDVASKPVAARWAQRKLGKPWAEIIAGALTETAGRKPEMDEMVALIRYTLNAIGLGQSP